MVCSNSSTDSNHRSIDIGSLLNTYVDESSATRILYCEEPAVEPIQSLGARYPASHHSYPAPTCPWSNLEGTVWQRHSSHSKRCEPYGINQSSSHFGTFTQSWLPPDVTVAPFGRPGGKPWQIPTDGRPLTRDKYSEEESFFIWYHRVDLGLDWRVILACFNTQFPDRQRSRIESIQCALYRFLKQNDCPPLRKQDLILDQEVQSEHYSARQQERASRFGVIARTNTIWYPWMRESPHLLPSAGQGRKNHHVLKKE